MNKERTTIYLDETSQNETEIWRSYRYLSREIKIIFPKANPWILDHCKTICDYHEK